MKIIIKSLELRQFKRIFNAKYEFGETINILAGKNGSGKTSILDAITWCLFGKDFSDRKKFYIMPLNPDQTEQIAIPAVSILLNVDGTDYELKREVEDSTTSCYINGVPKLVKEYQEFIARIFGTEDRFKMFSMPLYFPEKLEWKDQRELFMKFFPNPEPGIVYARMLAENIKFDQDLVESLKAMQPADYIMIHDKALKAIETEKIKINAQIELLDKQLEGQHDIDAPALTAERDQLRQQMQAYTEELAKANEYNSKILKTKYDLQNRRQAVLNKIQKGKSQAEQTYQHEISNLENVLRQANEQLAAVRSQFVEANRHKIVPECCPTCKQPMPAEMIEEAQEQMQANLQAIATEGNRIKALVQQLTNRIAERKELGVIWDDEIEKAILDGEPSIAEFDIKLDKLPPNQPPPELDPEIYNRLQVLDKTLARLDVHAENLALRQQAEATERKLNSEAERHTMAIKDAGYYIQYQSKIVVERINKEFKTISVRIFDVQKNGITKETFEITAEGVPYSGLNCTGQLMAGLELITFLKQHLNIEVPVIIDNGERYTDMDWKTIKGQSIIAQARRGQPIKLEVY